MIANEAARDAYLRRLDRRANDHLRRRHLLDGDPAVRRRAPSECLDKEGSDA